MAAADAVAVVASLVLGYVFGSLPLAALVGRMAGMGGSPRPGEVWLAAGPGWGLLAVAMDLARGVLPVTLSLVTFAWVGGLAAGAGAVMAAFWPALGRLPADRSVVLVLGVVLVLVPAAGLAACLVAVLARVLVRRSPAR